MIQLHRVRLINWHNFIDNTLSFEKITYLIGVNAVGKTTILDAIRYCLTTNKNFNALGNRKSSRTLQGSVHGKQRGENVYTRRGHTVSYIGVEFIDQKHQKPFVITVRVESENPEQEMRHIQQTWYISPLGIKLDDLPFIDQSTNTPNSKEKFSIPTGKMPPIEKQSEARNLICQRLGIGKADSPLGRKFSSVFPMGTSLDEISDFRTFIYEYILPQPEMDLESLQKDEMELENLQETLATAQRRAQQLKEIVTVGDQALEKERDVCINRGFILFAKYQADMTEESRLIQEQERCQSSLVQLEMQYAEAEQKEEIAHTAYMQAWQALENSDEGKGLEVLRKKEREIRNNIIDMQRKVSIFKNIQANIKEFLCEASKQFSVENEWYPDQIRNYPDRSHLQMIQTLEKAVISLKDKIGEKYFNLNKYITQLKDESKELDDRIRALERGQWVYPDKDRANIVRNAINKALAEQGMQTDAKVLCELLFMNDESWQDCVEANLGNRRFDILVSPEHYFVAKQVFEKMGVDVGGVSLLDSPALYRDRNKKSSADHTLATKVSSENPLAVIYIRELLGNIICCDSSDDLEKFPNSATQDLLRHYPYRLRRLPKQNRYIGLDARKQQLTAAKKQLRQVQDQLTQMNVQNNALKALRDKSNEIIHGKYVVEIQKLWNCESEYQEQCKEHSAISSEIEQWENNPLLCGLQSMEQRTKREWEKRKKYCEKLAGDKEIQKSKISSFKDRIDTSRNNAETSKKNWELFTQQYAHLLQAVDSKYSDAVKRNTPEQIAANYIQSNYQQKLENERDSIIHNQLIPLQRQYRQEYDSDFAEGIESVEFFRTQYQQMVQIDLERYSASLMKAKERCRERFRREILYRMKDDILNAQRQFRELNRIMKELHYGEERYRFHVQGSKNPDMERFYHLIMNDRNTETTQEDSLFNIVAMDDPAYEAQIDEFVERILSAAKEAVMERQKGKQFSEKQMIQWVDYRQYLDYDIIITNTKTDESVPLSKVIQDSSGGENQAPFYIAICASLLQIYQKCDNGIRLVLLDEAFSKMTSDRIKPMMSMFRQMNLQVLLITTVEKASAIYPFCDITYSIVKSGTRNAVAPFYLEVHND